MEVMVLVKQILSAERSAVSRKIDRKTFKSNLYNLTHRATTMPSPLRTFEGYSHGGIHE